MTTTVNNITTISPKITCLSWIKNGAKLYAKAPFKLTLLLVSVLLAEGIVQAIPFTMNVVVSKIVMALMTAGLWVMIDIFATTRSMSFKRVTQYHKWGTVLLLTPLLMAPFLTQTFVAWCLHGNAGLDLMLHATHIPITNNTLGVIFASGAPLSTLLLFLAPLLLIRNLSIKQAFTLNMKLIKMAWKRVVMIMILNALVLFLAPATFALSALLFGPLLLCIHYAAFTDLTSKLDA